MTISSTYPGQKVGQGRLVEEGRVSSEKVGWGMFGGLWLRRAGKVG